MIDSDRLMWTTITAKYTKDPIVHYCKRAPYGTTSLPLCETKARRSAEPKLLAARLINCVECLERLLVHWMKNDFSGDP